MRGKEKKCRDLFRKLFVHGINVPTMLTVHVDGAQDNRAGGGLGHFVRNWAVDDYRSFIELIARKHIFAEQRSRARCVFIIHFHSNLEMDYEYATKNNYLGVNAPEDIVILCKHICSRISPTKYCFLFVSAGSNFPLSACFRVISKITDT